MTARMGRTTCVHCRKPLGNGEALTDATVEVSERWSTDSTGSMRRVPVAPYEARIAAHAICHEIASVEHAASKVRYAREQIAEIAETIAAREAAGRPLGTLPATRARWQAEIDALT